MPTIESLEGKVAVVTGASGGIGKAMALHLGNCKSVLCLIGRKLESLEDVARAIRANSLQAHSIVADLTCDEDLRRAAVIIAQNMGRVDLLVHCAGEYKRGDVENAGIDDFDVLYRTNVRGCYLLTQCMLPLLKSSRGQIVFINSSQGLNAGDHLSQYAATKHALKAFADSLRSEVNPYGVRVLSVFAGRTATPLMRMIYEAEGKPFNPELLVQPEDIASVVVNALSLPRTAEVTNISIRPLAKSY